MPASNRHVHHKFNLQFNFGSTEIIDFRAASLLWFDAQSHYNEGMGQFGQNQPKPTTNASFSDTMRVLHKKRDGEPQ
jgi:hypothetical protein